MSGCENHAEPPKPSQGHQRKEDQLCVSVHASVCGCLRMCTDQQLGERA